MKWLKKNRIVFKNCLASKDEFVWSIKVPNLDQVKNEGIVVADSIQKYKPFFICGLVLENPSVHIRFP